MKKITNGTILLLTSFFLFSCQKESFKQPVHVPTPQEQIQPSPSPAFNFVSDWNAIQQYLPETDRNGNVFYIGLAPFDTSIIYVPNGMNYDKSTHVELAYLRIPATTRGTTFQYLKLATSIGLYDISKDFIAGVYFNFSVGETVSGQPRNTTGLNIYIKTKPPYNYDKILNEINEQGFSFRFIVIPKSKYQNTIVNWDDYLEVSDALNFIP